MVVADAQEEAVAQQENVVPCLLDNLVHIASHSNFAVLLVPAVAGVVVVLRFPLYLLYTYPLNAFYASFCSYLCLFYRVERSG